MHEITTRLGPLRCRVLQAEGSIQPRLTAVLCHGYGAPGGDLVPMGEALLRDELLHAVRFVFPEAPLSLEDTGMPAARAWWPLDLERQLRLQAQGPAALAELAEEVPAGLPAARRMLMSLVDELQRSSGLSARSVVLGGFSQGAMLATDTALALEEPPAALVILSGTLIARAEWQKKAARRRGLPVLQTHGRQDPLLGFAGAQALSALLSGAGLHVDFAPFEGGHTVPELALSKLASLLAGLLGVAP